MEDHLERPRRSAIAKLLTSGPQRPSDNSFPSADGILQRRDRWFATDPCLSTCVYFSWVPFEFLLGFLLGFPPSFLLGFLLGFLRGFLGPLERLLDCSDVREDII